MLFSLAKIASDALLLDRRNLRIEPLVPYSKRLLHLFEARRIKGISQVSRVWHQLFLTLHSLAQRRLEVLNEFLYVLLYRILLAFEPRSQG